jgi:transcriptional regulator with XRE-family HTH domain
MGLKFVNKKTQKRFEEVDPVLKFQMAKRFAIAEQIALILKDKKMTQKDLADRLGKNESEISKWLSGFHNLTKDTESLIEYHLGVNISVLVKDIKDTVYFFALSEQEKGIAIPVKSRGKKPQAPKHLNKEYVVKCQ